MKVSFNTTNNYNKNNQMSSRPVFKGGITDAMAKGFANLTKKDGMIKFLDKIAEKDVISTLSATTGVLISGFYIYNTAKSKKIEKEQKKPLMINMALVTAMSTVAGLFIDKAARKKIDDFTEFFVERNKGKLDKKILDGCKKGIQPAATLLIFTTIYRYLAPVLATPLANKISNSLGNKNTNKIDKKA